MSHPSPVTAASPPSPAVGSATVTASGIANPADQSQSTKAEPPGRQGSAWGHSAPPPASPSRRDASTGRVPRTRGPSLSGGSNAGEESDDREAIRARDERERDLAVRHRRTADLGAKAAGEANRQQHAQREVQSKKDADREREKVGRGTVVQRSRRSARRVF